MFSRKMLARALVWSVVVWPLVLGGAAEASNNVVVVVQEILDTWGGIDDSLNRYMADLTREGYTPQVYVCSDSGTTAAQLRSHLKSVYDSQGLAGAVFIEAVDLGAKIPRARYEETGDSGPCDLYYMDLDGQWTDSDSNGYFDSWSNGTGDMAPEIWVGRISTLMTVGDRLNPYFDRNHDYRVGNLTYEERALTWVSSSWPSADPTISLAYSNIDSFQGTESDPLTKEEYLTQIQNSYEYHFIASHASATSNAWITSVEIPYQNPHVAFYDIWGNLAGDFDVTMTCLAAEYVFGTEYGLGAKSAANDGGLYPMDDYYQPIADGASLGEAWYQQVLALAEADGSLSETFVDWAWGIYIMGDPTLRPKGMPIPEPSIVLLAVFGVGLVMMKIRRLRTR